MNEVYVSTHVETDGPIPGPNSLLSFASAAYTVTKGMTRLVGTFTANLQTLPGANGNPHKMDWWRSQPLIWAACRQNSQPPEILMPRYAEWLYSLPGKLIFISYPLGQDFTFVYWYLVRFTGASPFELDAIDIHSYAMAALKKEYLTSTRELMPTKWLGDIVQKHLVLDDAIQQGVLFCNMLVDNIK
jgi:hypothetical protein